MKIKILRIILLLLILGTCVTIFIFSNEDSEKSGSTSKKITEMITKRLGNIKKFENYNNQEAVDTIEVFIRKLAHFSIYSLLGLLIMLLFSTYNFKENKMLLYTLLIGLIYAITDEFHQSFIPGRSAQISDVLLDSAGVLFGSLIVLLVIKNIHNKNNKAFEKQEVKRAT